LIQLALKGLSETKWGRNVFRPQYFQELRVESKGRKLNVRCFS